MATLRFGGGVDGVPDPRACPAARACGAHAALTAPPWQAVGDRASRPPSPLELLHPDGFVRHAAVLGGGCPDSLRLSLPDRGGDRADLVLLAPTNTETRDLRWIAEVATSAARALTPDGLVYVLAPFGRRQAVVRSLARAGLVREATFVHLPELESSRHLVAADRRALRHALGCLLAPTPRRRLAAAVAALPGGELPFHLLADVGIVMRRPDARPSAGWLRAVAEGADPGCVIFTRTWRETGGSSVAHVFERSASIPSAVVKVGPEAREPAEDAELAGLETVAAQARLAGADTPVLRATTIVGGRRALLASFVPGRSAAMLLLGRPELAPAMVERLAGWLERWSRATRVPDALAGEELKERLLDLAADLRGHVPDAPAYESWIGELFAGLSGHLGPLVAAHNDLTMANVLIEDDRLGVIDWESARQRDVPLGDLFYAAVDAYAAPGGYVSRVAAFDSCYSGDGEEAETTRRLIARQRDALALHPAAVVACFHACWLGHAVNDVRRSAAADRSEFVEIAARMVRDRDLLAERLGYSVLSGRAIDRQRDG